MQKAKLKPLVAAILVASLGSAAGATQPAAGSLQEKVSVAAAKTLTPRQADILSSAGVKVLRHIAQARADIHNKDSTAVETELGKADQLLDIIQAALPTSTVKDRIWVAKKHLEYEDTRQVLPDLIPIYSSLDELMDVMPVKAARAQLDKARKNLQTGDKAKARKALEETDASLQYTEVDLPLKNTRQRVAQARADLGKQHFDEADKALQSAEDSVVFISVGVEQPLFVAKAGLVRSANDLEAGHKKLAGAELHNAIAFLQKAKKSPDAATSEAAGELLVEAQQLQADLRHGTTGVSARFHRLVERTQAYADRAVEYLATGWQRYRAEDQPLKSDLIEARLHLVNARIDLYTGDQPGAAKQQLGRADRYLDKAAQVVGKPAVESDYRKQIGTLRATLRGLEDDPRRGGPDQYVALQRQLDDMIATL